MSSRRASRQRTLVEERNATHPHRLCRGANARRVRRVFELCLHGYDPFSKVRATLASSARRSRFGTESAVDTCLGWECASSTRMTARARRCYACDRHARRTREEREHCAAPSAHSTFQTSNCTRRSVGVLRQIPRRCVGNLDLTETLCDGRLRLAPSPEHVMRHTKRGAMKGCAPRSRGTGSLRGSLWEQLREDLS